MRSVAECSASVSFSEKQAGEIESSIQHKLKLTHMTFGKQFVTLILDVMIELN